MKTKIKYLIIGIVLCLIFTYVFSLVKCEVLTLKHYHEFEDVCNTEFRQVNSLKVLDYSQYDMAHVYCIGNDNTIGEVLRFKYDFDDDKWYVLDYLSGWSKTGNADDIIYPYLWHWVYFLF